MKEEHYSKIFNLVASHPINEFSKKILDKNYELLNNNLQNEWKWTDYLNKEQWKEYLNKKSHEYKNKLSIIPNEFHNIDSTDIWEYYIDHDRNLCKIDDFYNFLKSDHEKYKKYEWCNINVIKLQKLDILLRDSCKNIIVMD